MYTGKVRNPKDLRPAIDALGPKGKSWLKGRAQQDEITPRMIAQAADFERGELQDGKSQI